MSQFIQFATLVYHSKQFHAALVGAVIAAHVDFLKFHDWTSFKDVENYSWSTAAFRWLQGAIIAAVGSYAV